MNFSKHYTKARPFFTTADFTAVFFQHYTGNFTLALRNTIH